MSNKVIRLTALSVEKIEKANKSLLEYAVWVERKAAELAEKLAERGANVARLKFTGAMYDGTNDVKVSVDPKGNTAVIYAKGKAVAFIEFGSGALMGYGHPNPIAGERKVGPGTWSTDPDVGKGHWDDPDGWYYKHGKKSHGNPPAMAMYDAVQVMTAEITEIAKEVFGSE